MGAEEGKPDAEVRVVLLQLHLLEVLLEAFVDFVGDGIFGQEEEELEDEHEERAEGDDFHDGQHVVFDLEEYGEDEPLGAQLLLTALFHLSRLQLEDDSVHQDRVPHDRQHCRRQIVKSHIYISPFPKHHRKLIFLTKASLCC